jgi:hypothetical protein
MRELKLRTDSPSPIPFRLRSMREKGTLPFEREKGTLKGKGDATLYIDFITVLRHRFLCLSSVGLLG